MQVISSKKFPKEGGGIEEGQKIYSKAYYSVTSVAVTGTLIHSDKRLFNLKEF